MQLKQATHANHLQHNHMTDPVVISQLPVKQTLIPSREKNAAAKNPRMFYTSVYKSCESWPKETENKVTQKVDLKKETKLML